MGQMRMTDAGTTQDNFILPAPPVGGLSISQDWLDRMKYVREVKTEEMITVLNDRADSVEFQFGCLTDRLTTI